ncbi:MAG: TRAM domain-containing protein [bacterium]|nr:TRAM domain-containing protein [bacterium]
MNPFELTIERWAWPGLGMGYFEEKAVFLPNVLPGERVRAELIKAGKKHLEARLVEVLDAADQRVQPDCRQYPACGGCGLLHLSYGDQLQMKTQLLGELLNRHQLEAPFEVRPAPQPLAYRYKASLKSDGALIGLNRYRSEQLLKITDCCLVLPPQMLEAVAQIEPRSDWDLKALLSRSSGKLALIWDKRGQTKPQVGYGQTVIEDYGAGPIELQAARFCQSNPMVTEQILGDLKEALGGITHLVEHYAGAGTLTLALAPQMTKLWAFESEPGAAKLGARNLGSFEAVRFKAARAEGAQIPQEAEALLVDPPRAGMASALVDAALVSKLSRIVYLSCDPQTQARDLARLVAGGFQLEWVRGYDMYPQTGHLESLALLSR